MSTVAPIAIIWCDVSFDSEYRYEKMKNDFCKTTSAVIPREDPDNISTLIRDPDREQFRLNAAPLIIARTCDEAIRSIQENKDKKAFLISSGSVGRYLVPRVIEEHPHIHCFYIFAHNIKLHLDWVDEYYRSVKMFDHPTDLLIRLTRDISSYLIKHGESFMQVDAPKEALECFTHAKNLEIYANQRDRMESNVNCTGQIADAVEFLENLNRLEGKEGLIASAETSIRDLARLP